MQQIMTQCFFAVKSKLHCRLGFFDLIGCDFMVDEDFKVGAVFLDTWMVISVQHSDCVDCVFKGVAFGDEL